MNMIPKPQDVKYKPRQVDTTLKSINQSIRINSSESFASL